MTVEKRVLLHLLEHDRGAAAFEVDFALSQAGVAQSIGVVRPAAARELIKLVKENLVSERTAHVRGSRRQRKVYSLTENGLEAARTVREGLLCAKVLVQDRPVKLAELLGRVRLEHPGSGLASLTSAIKDGNYSGLRLPGGHTEATRPLRSLEFSRKVAEPPYFFGRDNELDVIGTALAGGRVKAAMVNGMAGIGKTTMLAHFARSLKDSWNVFWFQVGRWSGPRSMVVSLGEFLARTGRNSLEQALSRGEGMEGLLRSLAADLEGSQTLLVVDDVHLAEEELSKLLRALLDIIEAGHDVFLLAAGRSIAPFYDRRHVKVKGTVLELTLEGLAEQASRELLQATGSTVPPEELGLLLELTRGHPLALELVRPLSGVKGSGLAGALADFATFLDEDVVGELTREEVELLELASVYRYPVPAEALLPGAVLDNPEPVIMPSGPDEGSLRRVEAKSLLLAEGGLYYLHDALREFFLEKLTPRERQLRHGAAARYYGLLYTGLTRAPPDSQLEEEAGLEMVHHLLEAGAMAEATEHLLEVGEELVRLGTVEVVELLERVPEAAVEPDLWRELLELKGDAAARMGNLDSALAHYLEDLAATAEGSPAQAQVLVKLGAVEARRGETEQALKLQAESLNIFAAHGDLVGQARTLNERGLTLKKAQRYNEARMVYRQALELLEDPPIHGMEGRATVAGLYCNLATLEVLCGRNREALECYEQAYDQGVIAGDRQVLFESLLSRGELLVAAKQEKNGLKHLQRASQLAAQLGPVEQLRTAIALADSLEGLARLVELLETLALKETAHQHSGRGLSILSRRSSPATTLPEGLKNHLGRCATRLETLAQEGADRDEAPELLSSAIAALAALGAITGAGRLALALGRTTFQNHGPQAALSYFQQALIHFERAGEGRGAAAAHYQMGRTVLAQGPAGDRAVARHHLERARALSKAAGLTEGVTAADQALSELERR